MYFVSGSSLVYVDMERKRYVYLFTLFDCEKAIFAYVNQANIRPWNRPVHSNDVKFLAQCNKR